MCVNSPRFKAKQAFLRWVRAGAFRSRLALAPTLAAHKNKIWINTMTLGRLLALACLSLSVSGALVSPASHAAEAPLPRDLQGLKGELLNLNRDIAQLEKELLFPSTEAAVVVTLEPGSALKVIDVKLLINEKDAGYHLYTDAELVALAKGGMQRIYTGNLGSGQHTLKAVINLRGAKGEEQRVATFSFSKGAQRKVIELKPVMQATTRQGDVLFREWDLQ
ncbi:MAG: hypothetical protein K0Q68_2015 [Moraxellaceae bacterium]|jgi:hypothetical protein|nr:hypothetical protein [Moraxellaceae bacterium]